MKWKQHKLVTGVCVFACTGNLIGAIIASAASIFPDAIEYWMPGAWQEHHRKTSHWFPIYLFPLLFAWSILEAKQGFFSSPAQYISFLAIHSTESMIFVALNFSFWFFVGCLCHLAEDAFCGGIPVFYPTERPKWFPRLFYVGKPSEYIFSYSLVLIALFVAYPQFGKLRHLLIR